MKKLLLIIILLGLINVAEAETRLIIKLKSSTFNSKATPTNIKPLSNNQLDSISSEVGVKVSLVMDLSSGAHVIKVNQQLSPPQVTNIIKKLQQDPQVAYVVEDRLLKPNSIPNINPLQWDMQTTSLSPTNTTWYGDDFTNAWINLSNMGLVPGSGVTIAVIDTGYTPHPNFLANLQALNSESGQYGYQFISDCRIAGTCPASTTSGTSLPPLPNGLDLGDFVTQSDIDSSNGFFGEDCLQPTSSWHGSHVTGTIVAEGYNGSEGVLGGAYGAKVIPIRALGKCGGYTSDILRAMSWAAGLDSIPNPNPAKVINMSLGGQGACDPAQQDTINQITAAGAVVVVSAGNSASDVANYNPASCANVISVAASGPNQTLAYYSNYGPVTIVAAGGNRLISGCSAGDRSCPSSILSTVWNSSQGFESSDGGGYATYQGTSMAAPHVAAAVANIISLLENKGETYSFQVISQILENSSESSIQKCSLSGCVSNGSLNMANAINYANTFATSVLTANPIDLVFTVGGSLSQTVTFWNYNDHPVTITGTQISGNSQSVISSNSCYSSVSGGVVLNPNQSCNITVTWGGSIDTNSVLQVFGQNGIVISSVNVSQINSSSSSSSGGGGCSMVKSGDDAGLILILLGGGIIYLYRRSRNQ